MLPEIARMYPFCIYNWYYYEPNAALIDQNEHADKAKTAILYPKICISYVFSICLRPIG